MKRFVLAAIMAFFAFALFAKSPGFAIEKFFDGRYNNNPKVTTTSVRNEYNTFRSLSIDPAEKKIIEEVTRAVEQDKKRANSVTDQWNGGKHSVILSIFVNEYPVSIGLDSTPGQNTEVFISGQPEAFK